MLTDLIAAPATPAGQSALAVLRMSGGGCVDAAARVLVPFHPGPPRVVRRAQARHPVTGETLDDVLYTVYHAPASYTGEDLVEISAHGGLLVPTEVLGALYEAGARAAMPGEFTRRAVLNGKMDLLQAEAIGDLVAATAPAQRRVALNQLDRGLSQRIERLRQSVLELEALISYEIDFPEEDHGPIPPERIEEATRVVCAECEELLQSAGEGERLREGALTVIAGRTRESPRSSTRSPGPTA